MTKKTSYYDLETIEPQAKKLLAALQASREKHHIAITPNTAALLVIDMQKFFVDLDAKAFVVNAPAIIPNIQKLQNIFLKKKLPVFQTRHVNTEENCGCMIKWWGKTLPKPNAPETDIISELKHNKIPIIDKSQYDAFWQTDLEQRLQALNISQLIITGVMTHLCCETTARSAFVRGFEVFFAIDATATHNLEFHFGSLQNLAHGFAIPLLTSEILENINAV
jgi:bifunctional isochorismate lyase/aryl carrier protein